MGIVDESGCSTSAPTTRVNFNDAPRWLRQAFGYWQPWRGPDGEWHIKKESKGYDPVFFLDEMDRDAGHKMDEDEALDKARFLNSIKFDGYEADHEYWFAVPWEQLYQTPCKRPPAGWECSRKLGHTGPCAARPTGMVPIDEAVFLFAGKSIQSVDATIVNKLTFYFTDGAIYDLWVEPTHGGFAELLLEVVATPTPN